LLQLQAPPQTQCFLIRPVVSLAIDGNDWSYRTYAVLVKRPLAQSTANSLGLLYFFFKAKYQHEAGKVGEVGERFRERLKIIYILSYFLNLFMTHYHGTLSGNIICRAYVFEAGDKVSPSRLIAIQSFIR
jgi:hypothetical protein